MTEEMKAKLQQAFDLLTDYLVDETADLFEEIPQVDDARALVEEVLESD